MEATSNFDAIIVGSGMGGMTVASLLSSRFGARVLLLEKHGKLGGFTHIFKRPKPGATDPDQKYEFDVGLHYVGQMHKGAPVRNAMDAVTGGAVEWSPMPDCFDRVSFPGFQLSVPKGRDRFLAELIQRFPAEEKAIRRYFKDVQSAQGWMMRNQMAQNFPKGPWSTLLRAPGRRLALGNYGDYLKTHFQDPGLRLALSYFWWDHGVAPSECPFVTQAIIAEHYWEGAYYPKGGSSTIGTAVRGIIEKAGGVIQLKTEVKKILTEGGRAVGVETADGKTYRAPWIYSNIGLQRTYEDLLQKPMPEGAKDVFKTPEFTVVTLYLGLRESPTRPGSVQKVEGENYWLCDVESLDSEEAWVRRDELLDGKAWAAYLSFPSLKDPGAKPGLVTAEIMAVVSRDAFKNWNGTSKSKRGEDYVALKARMTEGLLILAEKHIPGFRALVDFQELATPLTIEHYSSHRRGAIYGGAPIRSRYESGLFRPQTDVPGLYLCGTDAAGHGIAGALMGGVLAVGASKGWIPAFRVFGPSS
ncbi:MAG: NAD(P)/FAD-dependent oxidoreductase [Bdellovibrionales bacterium]|nr:NAD(P)/FAD-dependent oxidoreductase [Bdellovibrionales bacterium]